MAACGRASQFGTLLLALACLLSGVSCRSTWQVLQEQSEESTGSASQPSIRYAHAVASHHARWLLTHGYFYDDRKHRPRWQHDTWELTLTGDPKWRLLSAGPHQAAALAAYSAGAVPEGPCGRFGHSAAVYKDGLYVYGGHDGGHSRHGQDGYQPGYDFEELWRLDLQSNKWALLPAGGEPSLGTHPGPRYLHQTVVVDDSMFLFGGLTESEDAGVWEYNLSTGNWAAHNSSGNGPGPLASFAMAPVALEGGIRGFIVFGGRSLPEPDRNKQLNANIWFYDVRARAWRHIPPRQGSPVPKPRAYPGFALATPNAGLNTVGFLMGGTTTSGSMTCASDAWMFELDCHGSRVRWHPLPAHIKGVYDHSLVAHNGRLLAFGGHLCADTKGSDPFFYTNRLTALDASEDMARLERHACLSHDEL